MYFLSRSEIFSDNYITTSMPVGNICIQSMKFQHSLHFANVHMPPNTHPGATSGKPGHRRRQPVGLPRCDIGANEAIVDLRLPLLMR